MEYHRVWVYFARAFGIQLSGTVEERPGIPPGPQHVRQLVEKMKAEKIPLILVDKFNDPSLPRSIAAQTGSTVVILANQVEGEPEIRSYFDLINYVLNALVAANK
jgi:zinc/manganese transport system substrate-binding protein